MARGRCRTRSLLATWPARSQIGSERFTNVHWQREPVNPVALAADGYLAAAPVDVTELEISDLRAAHT